MLLKKTEIRPAAVDQRRTTLMENRCLSAFTSVHPRPKIIIPELLSIL
jgi:hypothetical protein